MAKPFITIIDSLSAGLSANEQKCRLVASWHWSSKEEGGGAENRWTDVLKIRVCSPIKIKINVHVNIGKHLMLPRDNNL